MEPASSDAQDKDPFQDVPEIESVAVNQGIIPESLLFWRRKPRKPAAAS